MDCVFELGGRSRRVSELIADKWAVLTLRRLERDGLVGREAYPVVPPRVEYSLTPPGETLIRIIAGLCRWAEEHIEEIEAARRDYDAREES